MSVNRFIVRITFIIADNVLNLLKKMAELPIDVNEDSFWSNEDQMALTPAERTSLRSEGLGIIGDFVDFKDDELSQAFKNMRISIAPVAGVNAVLDEEGAIVSKAIPNIPGKVPVALSTKCMKRLKIASKTYNYYYSIGRVRRFGNMHFTVMLMSPFCCSTFSRKIKDMMCCFQEHGSGLFRGSIRIWLISGSSRPLWSC